MVFRTRAGCELAIIFEDHQSQKKTTKKKTKNKKKQKTKNKKKLNE